MPSLRSRQRSGAGPSALLALSAILLFTIAGGVVVPASLAPIARAAAPEEATRIFTGTAHTPGTTVITQTAGMTEARTVHRSTLLPDGWVLIAGGRTSEGSDLSSAEIFDPATGEFSPTGSMVIPRNAHTQTLLPNGKVLVTGGAGTDPAIQASAELYDPATGSFTRTGDMNARRDSHSATVLEDGRVLVVGRDVNTPRPTADLYDPATGRFTATRNPIAAGGAGNVGVRLPDGEVLIVGPNYAAEIYDPETERFTAADGLEDCRGRHQATRLLDGRVLVTAGYCYAENPFDPALKTAEVYDPATGQFTRTGDLNEARGWHTATLLPSGEVLVAQGESAAIELYNPATEKFHIVGSSPWPLRVSAATLLPSGEVLITGGGEWDRSVGGSPPVNNAMLVRYVPGERFRGTLTLPGGWVTTRSAEVGFSGETSEGDLQAGALRNGEGSWGEWVPARDGETVATEWRFAGDGRNQRVWLRLRDASGQVLIVVSGLVNVDTTAPTGTIRIEDGAETTAARTVSLTLAASDATSGVAHVSFANDGTAWSEWEPFARTKSWSLAAGDGRKTVYARFRDRAGHVSPVVSDSIVLDTAAPTPEEISINGGALSSTSTSVSLRLAASDAGTGVSQMSFSNDGNTWSRWRRYAGEAGWTLSDEGGEKTVYARFRDGVGNVSAVVSDSIELDTSAEQEYGFSINEGARFTNKTSVTLRIGAPARTAEMRISNDGGFAGAPWEPFATAKRWKIAEQGAATIPRVVYVRYKDVDGVVSGTYEDDIILDVLPPTGSITIVAAATEAGTPSGEARQPAESEGARVTLRLRARDEVSGVDAMRLSNRPDFSGATWEPFASRKSWTLDSNNTVYVQFRDHAGNVSQSYSASQQLPVFLPMIRR